MDTPIRRLTYGEEAVRINHHADNETLQRIKRLSADLIDAIEKVKANRTNQAERRVLFDDIVSIKALVLNCEHFLLK